MGVVLGRMRGWFLVLVVVLMGCVSAIEICIDVDPPSAPGNLSVSGEVGNVLIEWDAANDVPNCSGVGEYVVARNEVEIGRVDEQSGAGKWQFVDNESLPSGEYNYTVYAVDMAGGNAGASVKNEVEIVRLRARRGSSFSSYVCEVNWSCRDWVDCVGGESRRICVDENRCGAEYLKPETYMVCEEDDLEMGVSEDSSEPAVGGNFLSAITGAVVGGGGGSVIGAGIFLLFSILGLVVVVLERRGG